MQITRKFQNAQAGMAPDRVTPGRGRHCVRAAERGLRPLAASTTLVIAITFSLFAFVVPDEATTVLPSEGRAGGMQPSSPADTLDADTTVAVALPNDNVPEEQREKFESVLPEGAASYYGHELAGRPTASGERFDPDRLTAAHRTLPFGTRLRVTNVRNGKSVVVRVNDRGPFSGRRVLDLSYSAARKIGMVQRGIAHVRMEVLK